MRFGLGVLLGVGAGVVVGAAVATWLTYATVTVERSYCTLCGMHREVVRTDRVIGYRRRTHERAGAVYAVFHDAVGAHPHHWSRPSRTDDPRLTETLTEEVARGEVADLEALEAHPGMISLLEESARADRGKALSFIQHTLDPTGYVGAGTVALLDRPGWPWEARWRLVDAFNANYRCHADDLSVSCTAPVGTIAAVMFQESAGVGVAVSASDWRNWMPPGFVAPTVGVPSVPSAPPSAVAPTPAQPTTPPTPSPARPDGGGVARPSTLAPAIARSRAALAAHDLDGALASYREARAISPDDPSVRSLAADIRQYASERASNRVTNGACEEAQAIDRDLRASNIEPDESMFGPFCPAP